MLAFPSLEYYTRGGGGEHSGTWFWVSLKYDSHWVPLGVDLWFEVATDPSEDPMGVLWTPLEMLGFAQDFREYCAPPHPWVPETQTLAPPAFGVCLSLARLGLGLGPPGRSCPPPREGWAAPERPPATRHAQRRHSIPEAHPSFLRKTCVLIRPPVSGFQNHPGTRTPWGRRDQSPFAASGSWGGDQSSQPLPRGQGCQVWGRRGRGRQPGGIPPPDGAVLPSSHLGPLRLGFSSDPT